MSDGPDPIAAALAEFRSELGDLRRAFVEEAEARTKGDRSDARDRREDAEDDVIAAAKRAGLSPKQYESAIAAAKKAQFKEDHADIIREIIDEILDEVSDAADGADGGGGDDGGGDDGGGDDGGGGDTTKTPVKKQQKKSDDSPSVEHWSDRPFSKIFGGR